MLDILRRFIESDSLAPHGICLLWRPELVWTHVVSDALIALAYFSIPVALAFLVSKRKDIAFSWVFWCFAVFITACGTTHLFEIWTLWNPDYGLEALIKAVTAAASVATAVVLWPLLPRILALPSPAALREANEALELRVRERDQALEALRRETAERLRTEEMLRQSQKMEAVGQLTGGVAHDFNNLLTVVIGNLERLQRRLPEGAEDARKAAANALAGAERAANLTEKLLAFARKQPLQPRQVDVNALIEGMAELVRRLLPESTAVRLDLGRELGCVRVDANQLENALLNLVVNARDAMGEHGTLNIATRAVPAPEAARVEGLQPGSYVGVEVTDTGTGMSKEVLERAFEPFFTTKPVGQGTGLGLSQVFGFLKQSDGHVSVSSEPGRGTTVRLFLPETPASAPAAELNGHAVEGASDPRLAGAWA